MGKKKVENIENENRQMKFKRVCVPRAKRIIYELNRLVKMSKSNVYQITDYDAQKLLDALNTHYSQFVETYTRIANNETVEKPQPEEIKIF